VREGCGRCRISQVVGRYVHSLERSNRALLRRSDALLERAHFSGEGWLIAHRARGAAEQSRHFGSRLRKPEDVVDEEKHILILLVPEVFGEGKTG
jgi:hypothetical protein